MRLIDADALLQELDRKGIPYNCAVNWEITHAPTVQTEPRRTGRWVTTSWDNAYFTCSECGREQKGTPRYCMNCGTRMTKRIKYAGSYNYREEPNGTDD